MVKNTKKILIAGDSFAALWPNANNGWVNLLAEKFNVVNIAQAGVGEYKIFKQIQNTNLNEFDCIIVSHTSPSRIHTKNHPLHTQGFHSDCDLIITDLIEHWNPFNRNLSSAKSFFKYHYDEQYQIDIYKLLREKINNLIHIPYISISHIDIANELRIESTHIDFSDLWKTERGCVNHYTNEGNELVYLTIRNKLNEYYNC
jgi:hypothetical protein